MYLLITPLLTVSSTPIVSNMMNWMITHVNVDTMTHVTSLMKYSIKRILYYSHKVFIFLLVFLHLNIIHYHKVDFKIEFR